LGGVVGLSEGLVDGAGGEGAAAVEGAGAGAAADQKGEDRKLKIENRKGAEEDARCR